VSIHRRWPFAVTRGAPLPAAMLLLGACAPAVPVDWRQADQCVGRVCAVRGTVVAAEDAGTGVRLYFDAERQVSAVLLRSWLAADRGAGEGYVGREVIATGSARRFRDHTELIVRDPADIQIVEAPTPPPSTYAPSTPIPAEQLQERIRDLERRVHELERQ
jgi:hypothetical protein